MTRDIDFRNNLKELLEEDAEDYEILALCLNQAYNQWPHSFEQWLRQKRRHGDKFTQ